MVRCVFFCLFFFPFWLVPPQRCLPVICIPKCSEKQQQETWVTWYPWQGFCSSTSAGQHYLLWALYIWEGASRGLKLLDSAPDLLCGSLKAYRGGSFAQARISCYSLYFFFFLWTCSESRQVMFTNDIHMNRRYLWGWEEKRRDHKGKAGQLVALTGSKTYNWKQNQSNLKVWVLNFIYKAAKKKKSLLVGEPVGL